MHAHHEQHIAFLFELDNLEAKLQCMLALQRTSALGRLRHGDSTSWSAFGLVWDLHVVTCTAVALLVCPEVRKCSESPENTSDDTTRTSCHPAATWDTHCVHMSYFVRRCCPYLMHFVHLKIEYTNLWGLDKTHYHNHLDFLAWKSNLLLSFWASAVSPSVSWSKSHY